jgi:type I restriction enzyme R subunit
VDKSFLRKTAEIVQQHTATQEVQTPTETHEIGDAALVALLLEEKPDTVKVFNLLKELYRLVAAKGREEPHLIPIGERAEAIRRAFEEQQLNSRQALEQVEALVRQLQEAQRERTESDLTGEAFAVAWWLRVQQGLEAQQAKAIAQRLDPVFRKHPHWAISAHQERELRKDLYKALLEGGVPQSAVVSWANVILDLLRRAT